MNKKVLSAILFSALFAGTGTFTSCIDNDEPAGIEELRGAKAELLRAKVAVEQAQASLLMAKAEFKKAEAAKELAQAEINKATAAIREAEAKKREIENEKEAAALDLLIAQNEMRLDSMRLAYQKDMLTLQAGLVKSQYDYEQALSKVAILKELFPLDTFDGFKLSILNDNVEEAKTAVDSLTEVVAVAQRAYDSTLLNKQYLGAIDVDSVKTSLADAEVSAAKHKAELAEMEAWLEEDIITKDWRAEIAKLDAKYDSLNKLYVSLSTRADLAEYSEEYKALKKATEAASKSVDVDSAYSYTYYTGVDSKGNLLETTYRLYGVKDAVTGEYSSTQFDNQFAKTKNADSLAAKAELAAINEIANYDDNGNLLQGNKLYNDKKYLASFTTEVKAFLDTIAAKTEADTLLLGESNKAIKAWKEALAKYNSLDVTTDFAKLQKEALDAINAVTATTGAKNAGTKLLAYYTALEKNGLELHSVPVRKYELNQETGASTPKVSLVALKTALADSVAVRYLVNTIYAKNKTTAFFSIGETEIAATTDMPKYYSDGVIKTEPTTKEDALKALQLASEKAFGPAENYVDFEKHNFVDEQGGYLHTQPSEADVKALFTYFGITDVDGKLMTYGPKLDENDNPVLDAEGKPVMEPKAPRYPYGQLGAYGKYIFAELDAVEAYAKNYKAIMANLEGAIAYWEAKYAILKAKYDAQQNAYKAALLAQDKYEYENIQSVDKKAGKIEGEMTEASEIADILADLVEVYLPEAVKAEESEKANYTEALIDRLQSAIDTKRKTVRAAERSVANYKIALELANTKHYTAFTEAEMTLNEELAKLEEAQAELDKALADLARGLEIIAGTTAE